MADHPARGYRSLAGDYHWLYDDVALELGSRTPGVRAALAGLPPGSRVLDAACGIGIDAGALARRGFRVVAVDACEEMVAATRERLGELLVGSAANQIRVLCAEWDQLGEHLAAGSFEAVLCVGNSIAHAPDASTMVAAFESFRSLLAPGGMLILDTHDWELLHPRGEEMIVDPVVLRRDRIGCIRTYRWRVPDVIDDVWRLDIGLVFVDGDRASSRSHPVELCGFTRSELRQRLRAAGYEAVALDAIPGDDRYTATARRPAADR